MRHETTSDLEFEIRFEATSLELVELERAFDFRLLADDPAWDGSEDDSRMCFVAPGYGIAGQPRIRYGPGEGAIVLSVVWPRRDPLGCRTYVDRVRSYMRNADLEHHVVHCFMPI